MDSEAEGESKRFLLSTIVMTWDIGWERRQEWAGDLEYLPIIRDCRHLVTACFRLAETGESAMEARPGRPRFSNMIAAIDLIGTKGNFFHAKNVRCIRHDNSARGLMDGLVFGSDHFFSGNFHSIVPK